MWSELGRLVFNNGEILKVGYSLTSDIIIFQKTLPAVGISLQVQSSYLDLQIVWRKIADLKGFRFPYTGVWELCLGKPLDKFNQLSNWGSRPLRKEQLVYAALDAYCLLEVYDILGVRLAELGIDINDFADNTLFDSILKKSKKKTTTTAKPRADAFEKDTIATSYTAQDIKFICNDMVEGLAKKLRKCGIDAICMSSRTDRNEMKNIAVVENRFILTKGSACIEVACEISSSNVMLPSHERLYIIVKSEDIFSRCMRCNSSKFILASQDHVKSMKCRKWVSNNQAECQSLKPPKRSFVLSKITNEICTSGMTLAGVRIQVDNIHKQILNSVSQFYKCEGCGKVYWEGDHFQHVLGGKLKDIICKE